MAEDTANWPFQLQDKPEWPFQLENPPAAVVDDTPLVKKGWEHLTGQRPLLKTGQSDLQTIKEVFHPVVTSPIPAPDPTRGLDVDVRPPMPEWYAEKLRSRTPESFLTPDIPQTKHVGDGSEALKSELQRTQERSGDDTRLLLEIVAGLVTAGKLPPSTVPSALTLISSGKLLGILRNLGPEAVRKTLIAAAPAAVDVVTGAPEKAPETFISNLAGEYIGGGTGRAVSKVGQRLDRARQSVFGQTDEGMLHSGVIRDLGDEPPLGIASGKYLPKAMDTAGTESMWTSGVRDRYESVTTTLDDELKRIQALHPGGKVTAERDRIAGRVQALGDETLLHSVPQEMRHQLDVLPPKINADLRAGYQTLDADYFSRQVPWDGVKASLPDVQPLQARIAAGQTGQGSLFADTVRLVDNIRAMPDTVSLSTAMDMRRTVDDFLKEARAHVERLPPGHPQRTVLTNAIQMEVEPILGTAMAPINKLIDPYMINLQAAKRRAQQLVAHAGVSDAVLEGQLAAGNVTGATVDPDVLLAYKLLKQPDFVNFSEAHGLRHEWLAASRLPGHPLIGESTATRSKGMADMIDGSMQAMTGRMTPEMTTAWRAMDGKYKQQAQLYNSQYISEMSEANLDDLMNGAIRLDRPNDIKALRQALGQTHGGGDMLDEVAQMWLTRRLQMATPGSTGKVAIDELLGTLDTMSPQAQQALFPNYPITAIRDTLRQGKDMVTAVDIASQGVKADPVALQEVMQRLTPKRRERVLSDVLHPMFTKGGQFDPIDSTHFLTKLQDLQTAGVDTILFTPEHFTNLYHLAHTARAVKTLSAEGAMRHSPAVRWLERGGPMLGGSAAAGAIALAYAGHPVKAAITGTVSMVMPVISAKGLSFLATNPTMVKLLTEGMTTSISARRAGEITGQILGNLRAHGLESEITEQPAPETAPAQQTQAAPGGEARSTD